MSQITKRDAANVSKRDKCLWINLASFVTRMRIDIMRLLGEKKNSQHLTYMHAYIYMYKQYCATLCARKKESFKSRIKSRILYARYEIWDAHTSVSSLAILSHKDRGKKKKKRILSHLMYTILCCKKAKAARSCYEAGETFLLRHWPPGRKRRRAEIKRRRARERVKAAESSGENETRRRKTKGGGWRGQREGGRELCLQYDRGLTRAKVARVTPSSY